MKEADLFRQYAHEAARSSSKATSQAEKDAGTCLHAGSSGADERKSARLELHSPAALPITKGDAPCPLISS